MPSALLKRIRHAAKICGGAMTIPTLGFEPDTTLARHEIALLQLNEAISLFVRLRFLPALTLAGAAEEILGKLLEQQGGSPVIKDSVAAIDRLRAKSGLRIMDDTPADRIIRAWNLPRNIAKHLIDPDNQQVTLNFCDEAFWMIRRAMANSKGLRLAVRNAQDFENWIVINVNT